MKKIILLLFLCAIHYSFAQTARQLENLEVFNKLYGYVKYFHPSDEAAALNWDKFAAYGSREVEKCNNVEELHRTLLALFEPIAPSIQIFAGKEESFTIKSLTPPDTAGFKVVTWQHLGLGLGHPKNIYSSVRTNRKSILSNDRAFSTITAAVEMEKYRNKEFRLTGSVRLIDGPGTAQLWARIDKPNQKVGFFDNMDDRPIASAQWKTYEIKGTVDSDAVRLAFGCFLTKTGKLMADNLNLSIREEDEWKTVYTNSFETDKLNERPVSLSAASVDGYKIFVSGDEASDGKQSVVIQGVAVEKESQILFGRTCKLGESVKKNIGSGLTAIIPLALYGNEKQTYPVASPQKLSALQAELRDLSVNPETDVYARNGDIIITWNVFQHFYPYFEVTKTDWSQAFPLAIKEAHDNVSAYDFLQTLRKFTARLKDGHVQVSQSAVMAREGFVPAIEWEWVENNLVITKVLDKDLPLKAGDIVTAVDQMSAEKYFDGIRQYISAATPGWLHHRAQTNSLMGPRDSKLAVTVLAEGNQTKELTLTRSVAMRDYYTQLTTDANEPVRKVLDGIYYINIGKASMEQIKGRFEELEKARTLICDLRGYPNSNHQLISHLLQQNDTSKQWMQVPQIIYPDQENITTYSEFAWSMKPLQPHLNAKVFFILDGRAISYAESFMSFIEHYNLATIIGQPSAGTNGNVNMFQLPGGYRISWTGMKVLKHDGSQLHGVGILPDIYVEKTIKGVRQNRDEFLDKAIQLAQQHQLNIKD